MELSGADFLIGSVLVLWLGQSLNRYVGFLGRNHVPIAVTGGLVFSLVSMAGQQLLGFDLSYDMRSRDLLLLVFFSTVGLSAKLRTLKEGGPTLAVLVVLAACFLVIQDFAGVTLALLLGDHPAYGLFAGSISFAGGHGTAIAWGKVAEESGLDQASEAGIAFATLGLIIGGLLGGPLAGRLVDRMPEEMRPKGPDETPGRSAETIQKDVQLHDVLGTVLALALCVSLGDIVNRLLVDVGLRLPGFLTSMAVGILIANVGDLLGSALNHRVVSIHSDVSLNIFLAMSLMSMDLSALSRGAVPIILALIIQVSVMTTFAVLVVYRIMGRDYDAAVIAGGFVGLGLGATPVAIANMHAITSRYGLSPKAFLVVPLVGAFFIDLLNAVVIKFFLSLPIMEQLAG
ncbi:MAG: sodium/glutamate symporter [Myxococcota bacterium]